MSRWRSVGVIETTDTGHYKMVLQQRYRNPATVEGVVPSSEHRLVRLDDLEGVEVAQ